MSSDTRISDDLDALIVGAGFAGLYQLHKLRSIGLRARILEKGGGVGGTWYWNRYPGARCDIPSLFYTASYTPEINAEWSWPERFGTDAGIRAYMEEIARRGDMLKDIRACTATPPTRTRGTPAATCQARRSSSCLTRAVSANSSPSLRK
jgi:cation diffusion facilitator CzcD-associated flavoprotein CzcO